MKIKETTERECCSMQKGDLVLMRSAPVGRRFYYYCKHCGRHFRDYRHSEPELDGLQPLPWPWESAENSKSTDVKRTSFEIAEVERDPLDFNSTHR